ncbi:MAG: nuclear transport factor 2 family protein [Microcella sp.]
MPDLDLAARLEALEARAAIETLSASYCRGADLRDLDLFTSVWAEHGIWRPNAALAYEGRAAIAAAMERSWQAAVNTFHWVSNPAITVNVEDGTATARFDVHARVELPDGTWLDIAGSYDDEYVCEAGRWLMQCRAASLYRTTTTPPMGGGKWATMKKLPRQRAADIDPAAIPTSKGVYVWFRDGEPVYVGEALGRRGLRGRLSAHLSQNVDMSHSTLRASVAVAELGITRKVARSRPTTLTDEQAAVVNAWIADCEVAWQECADSGEAHQLETELLRESRPPLNIE